MESKRSSEKNASGKRAPDLEPVATNSPQNFSGADSDILLSHCDHCTKVYDDPSGNWYHAGGCSVLLNKVKRLQIKMLAANIRSAKQLRKIIKDAQPKMQREVYNLIAPHITRFLVPTFHALMNPPGPRAKRKDFMTQEDLSVL